MKKRLVFACILIAWCAILVKVMVFKDMPTIRIGSMMLNFSGTESGHPPNFIPFKTIGPYLLGHKGFIIASINLIGNIALLVPIGLLVPFVFKNIGWRKCLLLSVAAGLTIELMQVLLNVGIFDIDDIILNALGVIFGYWAFALLTKWVRAKNYKNIVVAILLVIAATAAFLYAIYPRGHQPVHRPIDIATVQPDSTNNDSNNNKEAATPQGRDLCGGTGGTGRIISLGNNTLTIIRNDSATQIIKLTTRTIIKASTGNITPTDLKAGQRVTVVIDGSETASLVLVCNVVMPKTRIGK